MDACDAPPRGGPPQSYAQLCKQKPTDRLAPVHELEKIDLKLWWLPSLVGPAMNRFVHRIILSVLLVAALAIIWIVLGTR
ncbi:hypothetical protein [Bradyrhizobium centrolobii]|uniref:hypothetical protein n=1 Tax=Bradyrhizobium centrolobii TaxID=1505087 RepID=UPI0007C4EB6E|nr:hypothetical protein [Bradyrhizobium centrolobii]